MVKRVAANRMKWVRVRVRVRVRKLTSTNDIFLDGVDHEQSPVLFEGLHYGGIAEAAVVASSVVAVAGGASPLVSVSSFEGTGGPNSQ